MCPGVLDLLCAPNSSPRSSSRSSMGDACSLMACLATSHLRRSYATRFDCDSELEAQKPDAPSGSSSHMSRASRFGFQDDDDVDSVPSPCGKRARRFIDDWEVLDSDDGGKDFPETFPDTLHQ